MNNFEDFIKYLLITDQIDTVFWGKEKEEKSQASLPLKRVLKPDNDIEEDDNS